MNLTRLSDGDLIRLVNRYWDKMHRYMGEHGGDKFGWDWPTFAIIWPHVYRTWRRLKAEARKRPHICGR